VYTAGIAAVAGDFGAAAVVAAAFGSIATVATAPLLRAAERAS